LRGYRTVACSPHLPRHDDWDIERHSVCCTMAVNHLRPP